MKEKYPIDTLLALREQDRPVVQYGEVVTYKLSPAEIERKYGKPGEFAEPVSTAITNGWPDMGGRNERHFARKERYGLTPNV